MIDKIVKQLRLRAGVKKACVFFAAFAATLVLMGGTFGFEHEGGIFSKGLIHAAEQDSSGNSTNPEETVTGTKASADNAQTDATAAIEKMTVKPQKVDTEDAAAKPGGFVYNENIPMSKELQEYTYQKCVERSLEYELVLAIIWRESRFETDAVHINADGTQDSGIMQINDVNKGWLYKHHGIEDLMDPFQNINAGTALLGKLTAKYGSHKAMMAYQYGENGMNIKLRQGYTTSVAIEKAYARRDYYRQFKSAISVEPSEKTVKADAVQAAGEVEESA